MPVSRRGFIRTLGGSGIVLAAGAVGLNRCDRMPDIAVAPWTGAMTETDPRRFALAHALLAPNPHNMQPWLADLRIDGEITLYPDPERLLPETDPYGRQILIGHGAFIELLDLAAREQGYRLTIDLFPDGEAPSDARTEEIAKFAVARIAFFEDRSVLPDPLFRSIPERRSNKEPFDVDRPLTAEDAALLEMAPVSKAVSLTLARDGATATKLSDLVGKAMLLEMQTPAKLKESIDVTRIGAEQIALHRDGIDLNGPMFWWLNKLGFMTAEAAQTPGTMAYKGGIDYALGWSNATRSFGWLTTQGNSRKEQVMAGRAYVRVNLAATAAGVAMHPVSQLLQEYREMEALKSMFLETAQAAPGSTVQMLFRLGYAPQVGPSPRRDLNSLIIT